MCGEACLRQIFVEVEASYETESVLLILRCGGHIVEVGAELHAQPSTLDHFVTTEQVCHDADSGSF